MARHSSLIVKEGKFSEDIELFFCKLAKGIPCRTACALTKLSWGTVKTWISEGRKLIAEDRESYTESEKNLMLFSSSYECACAAYEEKIISLRNSFLSGEKDEEGNPLVDKERAKEIMVELKARHPDEWSESRINKKDEVDSKEEPIVIINDF